MKKILSLLLLSMFFLSCEGPAGYDGMDGISSNWHIVDATVFEEDWILETNDDFKIQRYSCKLNLKDVSRQTLEDIYDSGNATAYIYIAYEGKEYQTALPLEFKLMNKNNQPCEEQYSFDFGPDGIVMNVIYINFDEKMRPETMDYRIVFNWPN